MAVPGICSSRSDTCVVVVERAAPHTHVTRTMGATLHLPFSDLAANRVGWKGQKTQLNPRADYSIPDEGKVGRQRGTVAL
jgi:hypothetical protein